MASSGSFNTNGYQGRYVKFEWSISNQSVANNQTEITWTLKGAGTASSSWYMAGPFKVTIDGEEVYSSSSRIKLYDGTVIATGKKVIGHNTNGKRDFSASATAAIYSGSVNCSGSGSWSITDIPRAATLLTAPDFNDEGNPTITYSNPAGNSVSGLYACISLTGAIDDIAYRAIPKTGTSYTFNLTEAERNVLRNATITGNSRTVSFFVSTVIGSSTYYSAVEKTLTIVNAQPTLNPTVYDTGSISTTLTGDTSIVINGFNVMQYSIGATAKKGATIVEQFIECNGYKNTAASGTLDYVTGSTFNFYARDSRGNEVTDTITLDFVDYKKLTCELEASIALDGETTSKITYKATGNYWTGSFGAKSNTWGCAYRLKVNNEEYGSARIVDYMNFDETNNTYELGGVIEGLDYKNTYTIQVEIYDRVYSSIFSREIQLATIPVFDWGKEDFNFNVPVTINNKPIIYPVEEGTSGYWHYKKWNNGELDCWGDIPISFNTAVAWGYGYISSNNNSTASVDVSLPSGMFATIEAPVVTVYKAGSLFTAMGNYYDTSKISLYIWAPTGPYNNVQATASIRIKGTWNIN